MTKLPIGQEFGANGALLRQRARHSRAGGRIPSLPGFSPTFIRNAKPIQGASTHSGMQTPLQMNALSFEIFFCISQCVLHFQMLAAIPHAKTHFEIAHWPARHSGCSTDSETHCSNETDFPVSNSFSFWTVPSPPGWRTPIFEMIDLPEKGPVLLCTRSGDSAPRRMTRYTDAVTVQREGGFREAFAAPTGGIGLDWPSHLATALQPRP